VDSPHAEKAAYLAREGRAVSVGLRVPIVATIITLILAPGGPSGGKPVKTKVDELRCIRGEPIPTSPQARKLKVVGETCRHVITRIRPAKPR
jgi:hypothetical protein